ncbi:uncharacterized protein LOC142741491 [Rhinoderma darwinii]|uniref:uncharacterized protein LOC142741491 n=1 Tax=Rhinoderma darwinii TaxID=43563 RepID=UPI003F676F58
MDYPLFFPDYVPASLYIKELQTQSYIEAAVKEAQVAERRFRTLFPEDVLWIEKVMKAPREFRPFKFKEYKWRPKLETIMEVAVEETEDPVQIPRTLFPEDVLWIEKVMKAPREFRPFKFKEYKWRPKLETTMEVAVEETEDPVQIPRTLFPEDVLWIEKVMKAPREFRPFKFKEYKWRPKLETTMEVAVEETEDPVQIPRKTSWLSRLRSLFCCSSRIQDH